MYHFQKHLIKTQTNIKEALTQLDKLASDAILFVVDKENRLLGSLTDGDVRRGLIGDKSLESLVDSFMKLNPKVLRQDDYSIDSIISHRESGYRVIPVITNDGTVVNIINLRRLKSYLPIDAVIMAGGRGERLRPLTDTMPKPLLKVGDVPIIERNIDRLASYGIDDFWISVRYLGEKLEAYFGNGEKKNVTINYLWENDPLGTVGAVSQIDDFKHDYILITNSDLLTDLNYEDFFLDFLRKKADFAVLSIPYEVKIPYAVLETSNNIISSFKEKPTYTYYSNGGVYLMKKSILDRIPKGKFYNATDLLQDLINDGMNVVTYPFHGYWLDIGKHDDFEKAQEDVSHLDL